MTQVSHSVALPGKTQSHRAARLAALLTLAVIVLVATLVIVIDDGPATQSPAQAGVQAQPSPRSGGGPEESAVAASVAPAPVASPNEASTAAAVGSASPSTRVGGPDESAVAAAVAGQ